MGKITQNNTSAGSTGSRLARWLAKQVMSSTEYREAARTTQDYISAEIMREIVQGEDRSLPRAFDFYYSSVVVLEPSPDQSQSTIRSRAITLYDARAVPGMVVSPYSRSVIAEFVVFLDLAELGPSDTVKLDILSSYNYPSPKPVGYTTISLSGAFGESPLFATDRILLEWPIVQIYQLSGLGRKIPYTIVGRYM